MGSEKSESREVDEAAVRGWFDTYIHSVTSGDFEAYLDSWSEDMVFLPPGQPALSGKKALAEFASAILENDVEIDHRIEEIVVDRDFAYARLEVKERFTPKTGGGSFEIDIKSVFVFRRQADGSWLGSRCIWNSNIPEYSLGG